jgi:hypothetical protein
MPKKRENSVIPLPGFDIFEQPMPESDRDMLLKPHYRRKQLAGFVPLWNEFFRCYHLAGVSPTAAYLWAYLRQYEHERREWNAISDLSWPGRRDIAEALGVSISHLPNLLNQLRQAGLLSFQPVLPGFEDLAVALGTDCEAVRERAADYGVNPKIDGTLYRTSDPFTKTEFASLTNLKYCKGCKAYRYCEGVKEARVRMNGSANNSLPVADYALKPAVFEGNNQPTKPTLASPPVERTLRLKAEHKSQRIQVSTATVSKKIQSPLLDRIGERFEAESGTVSKKVRPVNPSRVKTMNHEPTLVSQPEKTTTILSQNTTKDEATGDNLVVVSQDDRDLEYISPEKGGLDLLLKFGYDSQTANHLLECANRHNKPAGYLKRILNYATENARQNPQGMARRLIELGEDRLSRADRWQQSRLFDAAEPEMLEDLAAEEIIASPGSTNPAHDQPIAASSLASTSQVQIAKLYRLTAAELNWWHELVGDLKQAGWQEAAVLFGTGVGIRREKTRLVIIMRNLFDQQRALVYTHQLERAYLQQTGQLPKLEFLSQGEPLF